MVGAILASGLGVGSGSLAEYMDKAVYNSNQLAGLTHKSVLASVPYIETKGDKRRKLWKKMITILLLLLAVAAFFSALHFLIMPLDQLWLMVQKKFQAMT
jgi:capsular polysaccharide biosynthesis protein